MPFHNFKFSKIWLLFGVAHFSLLSFGATFQIPITLDEDDTLFRPDLNATYGSNNVGGGYEEWVKRSSPVIATGQTDAGDSGGILNGPSESGGVWSFDFTPPINEEQTTTN